MKAQNGKLLAGQRKTTKRELNRRFGNFRKRHNLEKINEFFKGFGLARYEDLKPPQYEGFKQAMTEYERRPKKKPDKETPGPLTTGEGPKDTTAHPENSVYEPDDQIPSWLTHIIIPRLRPNDGVYKTEGHSPYRFKPERFPTEEELANHFCDGQKKVGGYLMEVGSDTIRLAVIDIDDHSGELGWDAVQAKADAITQQLVNHGLKPARFRSSGGKGIHLVVFWDDPQDAYSVRQLLKQCVYDATGCREKAGDVEVFPKQDRIEESKCGNPVFFPIEKLNDGEWLPSEPVPVKKPEPKPQKSAVQNQTITTNTNLKLLRLALLSIPNEGEGQPYGGEGGEFGYLAVGMALHNAYEGSQEGLELWHEWASQSDKYIAEDVDRRWASFKSDGQGFTMATIFGEAKKYSFDQNSALDTLIIELASKSAAETAVDEPTEPAAYEPPIVEETYNPFPTMELFDNAPGLVGEVARWIMNASYVPRKEFAYACALSMVSTLIGPYCVQGTRHGKLNLYLTLVGGTGTGKNEAFDTMGMLLSATEAKNAVISMPASEAAMRRRLNKSPNILIRIDELAHKFESMQNNPNGASLFHIILEAYNGARMPPMDYADEKKSLPAVENPYVQIISGTTDKVWDVLKKANMDDGTLNRFIFVCLHDEPEYSHNSKPCADVSKELKDRINKFWHEGKRYDLVGYMPPGFGRQIGFAEGVEEAINKLDRTQWDMQQANKEFAGLYNRYVQNTVKIACILAISDGRLKVEMADFEQAKAFMGWCLENTYQKCNARLGGNEFDKLCKAFMAVFDTKKWKGKDVPYYEFANNSRIWKKSEDWRRKSAITVLTKDRLIQEVEMPKGGKGYRKL